MPKYAYFNHDDPPPARVQGWYDTDAVDYGDRLPSHADLLPITDGQWSNRMSGFYAVQGGTLQPYTPPPAPAAAYDVPKLLVVERLAKAGILRAARAALHLDGSAEDLADEQLLLRERWLAARDLRSDDPQVRGLIQGVGGNADEILARP